MKYLLIVLGGAVVVGLATVSMSFFSSSPTHFDPRATAPATESGQTKAFEAPILISKAKSRHCPSFYKDTNHVYYQIHTVDVEDNPEPLQVLEAADPSTFYVLTPSDGLGEYDCTYSRDEARVYWLNKIVPAADPKTFRGLGLTDLAHDKNSVYFRAEKIDLNGSLVRAIVADALTGNFYLADNTKVYYVASDQYGLDNNSDYTFHLVTGVDAQSYVFLKKIGCSDGIETFTKDSKNVYIVNNIAIDGADPATFKIISPEVEYLSSTIVPFAQDSRHIYACNGQTLK